MIGDGIEAKTAPNFPGQSHMSKHILSTRRDRSSVNLLYESFTKDGKEDHESS